MGAAEAGWGGSQAQRSQLTSQEALQRGPTWRPGHQAFVHLRGPALDVADPGRETPLGEASPFIKGDPGKETSCKPSSTGIPAQGNESISPKRSVRVVCPNNHDKTIQKRIEPIHTTEPG